MNELHRSIEAILMVVDEPVSETTLAQVLEHPVEEIEVALTELIASFEGRGTLIFGNHKMGISPRRDLR